MAVSGLVLSLIDEPGLRGETLAVLEREPTVTMGVLQANQLVVVLDTPSIDEDRRLVEWLRALPGITFLEVAFVGFEEPDDSQAGEVAETPKQTTCDPMTGTKEDSHDGR